MEKGVVQFEEPRSLVTTVGLDHIVSRARQKVRVVETGLLISLLGKTGVPAVVPRREGRSGKVRCASFRRNESCSRTNEQLEQQEQTKSLGEDKEEFHRQHQHGRQRYQQILQGCLLGTPTPVSLETFKGNE